MFVILVYDVAEERVSKVCQFLRLYLNWIQNSVFEGEVTQAEFMRIVKTLKTLIDENTDSVIIYTFSNEKLVKRVKLGIEKAKITNIL